MAYDKHTWTCDEPITVERLNHIEDGIANAGGDCGFECEETRTLLAEESVTTTVEEGVAEAYGELSYSQLINRDTIAVTFNGTEYQCEVTHDGDVRLYGALYDWDTEAYDWSEYPFAIGSHPGSADALNELITPTAGTYSVKIEGMQEVATTTQCFEKAVKSVVGDAVYVKMSREYDTSTRCESYTLDLTATELQSIIENGQQLVIVDDATLGAIYYPTYMWAKNATPSLRVGPVIGEVIARVIVTVRDVYGDERLLTLSATTGTLSQNLTGTLCGTVEDLKVPLNQDISRATASAPAKSIAASYDEIMYALDNGATVYIVEFNKATHLVTSFYKDSSNKINSTVTVNIETTDGNLGITYSKPITFHFDADGYAYYPASAT